MEKGSRVILYKGSQGAQVRTLQEGLADLGYYSDKVDGIFGPVTEEAVTRFQLAEELGADGFVGPQTWSRLGIALDDGRSYRQEEIRKSEAFESAEPRTTSSAKGTKRAAYKPPVGRADLLFEGEAEISVPDSEDLVESGKAREAVPWEPQGPQLAGFLADDLDAEDRLGLEREVDALCSVILARDVSPPLSIGLFGDWGVGKSFFIKEMMARVEILTEAAARVEGKRGQPGFEMEPAFWSDVAQIRFNAWHYMDTDLWASLVASIFDGLAEHVQPRQDGVAQTEELRQKLLAEMELANEAVRELRDQRDTAEQERKAAEAQLVAIARDIERQEQRLPELDAEQVMRALWRETWNANSELRTTLNELGLGDALEGAEDARDQVKQLVTGAGRVQAQLFALIRGHHKGLLLAALLLVLLASSLVGEWLDLQGWLGGFGTAIASLFAWVAGFLLPVLRRAGERLDRVQTIYRDFLSRGETEKASGNQEKERLLAEIEELQMREDAARTALDEAKTRVALIEQQIADLKVGRRLFEFIEERAHSPEYRDRLGIIALVRRDFDRLSRLLGEQSELKRRAWYADGREKDSEAEGSAAGPLARIDRILLYIDDLDRCPPARVVEVMQAVHLLLAFRLFVVVVAVDSRWLLLSLEKGYPDFLVLDRESAGDGTRSLARWSSTPQSYLEKIFQIPLHLSPMSPSGYSALLEDVAGPVSEGASQARGPRPETSGRLEGSGTDTGPVTKGAVLSESGEGRDAAAGKSGREGGKDSSEALPAVDLFPRNLEITRPEVDFMVRFHGVIATPRGLKRFVNTYRLLRISVPPEEQDRFLDRESGEFHHAVVLLALLVGYAHEAGLLFGSIMGYSNRKTWRVFVEGLTPKAVDKADVDAEDLFENEVTDRIPAGEVHRWQRLQEVLAGLETLRGETLEPFQSWVPRIARYAFYPIRLDARGRYVKKEST